MALVQRNIDLQLRLGTGSFGDTGFNTIDITGLRIKAEITAAGGETMGRAEVRVYGLSLSTMNQVTTLTPGLMLQRNNTLAITAGDDVSGMATVFQGTISDSESEMELNSQPDTYLKLTAYAGYFQKIQPIAPSSYPGTTDVGTIMASLANQMGLIFENNGVTETLSTPYFPGTAFEQVRSCAFAANINWAIDNGILAIWPKGGSRGNQLPIISTATGMVGYPAIWSQGISVKTLFNPQISIGNLVQVQSQIPAACGEWFVSSVSHNLESLELNGQWFTSFLGAPEQNSNSVVR